MDNPWNDSLKSWNDSLKSWNDSFRAWTAPHQNSMKKNTKPLYVCILGLKRMILVDNHVCVYAYMYHTCKDYIYMYL